MELTPGKLYQLSCHNPHISNFVLFQTEEEANELCHSGNIIPITETFMFLRATKASKFLPIGDTILEVLICSRLGFIRPNVRMTNIQPATPQ